MWKASGMIGEGSDSFPIVEEIEAKKRGIRCAVYSKLGSVVEWLKRRTRNQHALGSKPTRAILLCPWERHFTTNSPAWWSWQAVLNYSHISKLQADSNILVSPEAGRGNCLPYVLAPPSLSCESEG